MMPLLQSSANASFAFDFTQMPLANLIVLVAAILLLIGIVLFVFAKYVGKIGPIEMRDKSNGNAIHEMNSENDEHDAQLRVQARLKISILEPRIDNTLYDLKVCPITRIALKGAIKYVMTVSASDNHFTTVLMPDNRDEYLNNLLRSTEDLYVSICSAVAGIKCEKYEPLMPWDRMRETAKRIIIEWINLVSRETIKTCLKKIGVCEKYEPRFKGDSYRSGIVVRTIAKNKKYIEQLDSRRKSRWEQEGTEMDRRGKAEWS